MSEPFIGQIILAGFNFCPRGFAECNGQILAISSNSALFSLLGTMYGGDGRTTFGLPDLRGRAPIGVGQGPGLVNRPQGQRGGTETQGLTTNNLPSHDHELSSPLANLTCTDNVTHKHSFDYDVWEENGALNVWALKKTNQPDTCEAKNTVNTCKFLKKKALKKPLQNTTQTGETSEESCNCEDCSIKGSTGKTGGNLAHNNMQPYLAMKYCIALVGLYPSRS